MVLDSYSLMIILNIANYECQVLYSFTIFKGRLSF